jgi:hypothetical protein
MWLTLTGNDGVVAASIPQHTCLLCHARHVMLHIKALDGATNASKRRYLSSSVAVLRCRRAVTSHRCVVPLTTHMCMCVATHHCSTYAPQSSATRGNLAPASHMAPPPAAPTTSKPQNHVLEVTPPLEWLCRHGSKSCQSLLPKFEVPGPPQPGVLCCCPLLPAGELPSSSLLTKCLGLAAADTMKLPPICSALLVPHGHAFAGCETGGCKGGRLMPGVRAWAPYLVMSGSTPQPLCKQSAVKTATGTSTHTRMNE